MEPVWQEKLQELTRHYAKPSDKHGHQPRLYALASLVGIGLPFDDDVVFAAAYLHDLGVFVGQRPEDPLLLARWDHVAYACERAPRLLAEIGFPADKVPHVLAVIRTHQPQDEPLSNEARILRDADILEQLGAIGILRAVVKVGRDTRYTHYSEVIRVLERNLSELPTKIRLETTKRLAEPKIEVLRLFLEAVRQESYEHLD